MPQSLSKVYLHVVFSTKNRHSFIDEELRIKLQPYIVKAASNMGVFTEEIYIMPDHLHWLCTLPRTLSISELIQKIKISSSLKIKEWRIGNFGWQKGYGVFSVSQSKLEVVRKYIQCQPVHHQKLEFKSEFIKFLEEYRIEYDLQYVWD